MKDKLITPDLKSLFLALPKAEQHVHLAGAYPKYKMREFFREKGVSEKEIAKVTSPQDLYNDLTDFVSFYMTIAGAVKTKDQIKQAAYAICLKAAGDNVRYMELKLASSELDPEKTQIESKRLEIKEAMYRAIVEGVNEAKAHLLENGYKQTIKFMYTAERHEPPEISLEDAKLAVKWASEPNSDFIGFDLAGDEINFSVERHAEALQYAKDNGLKITCHAGEAPKSENLSPVESIKRSIELGATRIGHGLAVCDDEELLKTVKDNNISFEVSPCSNIATLSVKKWSEHPLKKMLENGVKVSICSDDPAMFNTKISHEFEKLYINGLVTSWEVIKQLIINSAETSFAPDELKARLVKRFKDELDVIENDAYFSEVIKKRLSC